MVHISPIAEVDDRVFCGIMMACGCQNIRGLTKPKGDQWIILADFACQGGDIHVNEVISGNAKTSEGLAAWDVEAKSTANDFEKEFLNG